MKVIRSILFSCGMAALCASVLLAQDGAKKLRIVSLMPSNTEVAFDLGAGDNLVGVTTFCNYPPEAQKITKVGDFIHPNIEKIVSLKPDVVLAGQWASSPVAERLEKLGLRVVQVKLPATLEEIYETIFLIGKEIGREKEADRIINDLKQRVGLIAQKSLERKYKPRIYIHVDHPNWTVSKLSFVSDAMERCGAVNVFRDMRTAGAQVSLEAIIEKDPEVLILSRKSKKEILSQAGWTRVNAVQNDRIIIDIDNDWLSRPTPRILLAMERLAENLSRMKFE